jgi:hypothetical protein
MPTANRFHRLAILATAFLLTLALAACGGDGGDAGAPTPTPSGSGTPVTGTVDVRVTDAPDPSISAILITASSIQVHRATASDDAWETVVEGPVEFDLLKVVSKEQSLGTEALAPGAYTQVRLQVDRVIITKDGVDQEATVPSSELKLVRGFEVIAGETTVLTVDFDAEKSVVAAGPNLLLKPVVKLLVRKGTEPFVPENAPATPGRPTATPVPPTATPTPTPTPEPGAFVLHITDPVATETIATTATINVAGRTRPDAVLTVNDSFVEPDIDGLFSTSVTLSPGPNVIEVVASIGTGEQLSSVLTVIYTP